MQNLKQTKSHIKCQHYWLIDTPNGAVSKGVCKYCHEVRDYHNAPLFDRTILHRYDLEVTQATEVKQ